AAKEPGERFSSASDLLDVLEAGESSAWWRERAKALRIHTRRPLRRIRIPRETALYGREEDLAKLASLYEKAKAGSGQVLLVEGEAGIGKTRLVDEFVASLRQEGEDFNFLFGAYPPGGAATAAGAFSTAYREHFGEEALEATLGDYLAATPVLIPAFAALLKGEPPPEGKEALTKDSLQTVFVHATRGLAAERPTVVSIDDLHFAPEEGRALFASLALAAPGHRILLVGTLRPGVPQDWIADVERLEHASRTVLRRLGAKDLARLLEDAFRSERLAAELGHKIARKSDGNPFFAFEIIRGLRESQLISRQPNGTWATTKVIHDIEVPSSVLDLVNARVGDLSDEERDLLDVGACCGFHFDPLVVAAATGESELRTLKRLSLIERRHRLVRSSGRVFAFDHHQVQEAIYGGLAEPLRERLHAAIGEALEAREGAADGDPKDLDGALCVDLCRHFLEGAQGERALRYLDEALDHLSEGYLNDQAIALAERTLKVPGLLESRERVMVLLRTNGFLDLLGRREEQALVLAEARALAEAAGERVALMEAGRATAVLLWSTGRYEEAREHYERCLAIARETGDRRAEAGATGDLGTVFHSLGRYGEAKDHHERHLAAAREIGDRKGEAMATGNLGNVFFSLGRYGEARAHYERWLVIAHEIGNRRAEARATGNLGNVFYALGRYGEAQARYERHMAIAREIGDRRSEGVVTGNLGNILYALGRYGEAMAHGERSLARFREIGDRQREAHATGVLGETLLSLGRCEEAR
ncbi:MAG: ATP-binding protein, partial [Planctomycetota bacterium]